MKKTSILLLSFSLIIASDIQAMETTPKAVSLETHKAFFKTVAMLNDLFAKYGTLPGLEGKRERAKKDQSDKTEPPRKRRKLKKEGTKYSSSCGFVSYDYESYEAHKTTRQHIEAEKRKMLKIAHSRPAPKTRPARTRSHASATAYVPRATYCGPVYPYLYGINPAAMPSSLGSIPAPLPIPRPIITSRGVRLSTLPTAAFAVLRAPLIIKPGEASYICDICGIGIKDPSALKQHKMYVHSK